MRCAVFSRTSSAMTRSRLSNKSKPVSITRVSPTVSSDNVSVVDTTATTGTTNRPASRLHEQPQQQSQRLVLHKPVKSEVVGKRGGQRGTGGRHLQPPSGNNTKLKHECPFDGCPWRFATPYKLRRHIKSHTKETPYQVKLKMEYLEDVQLSLDATTVYGKYKSDPTGSSKTFVNRDDWYRQQALRAVNQAVGRVIRHRNDYGAILLCDERFSIDMNREQLSPWLLPYIRIHESFGSFQKEILLFFKSASSKYGTSLPVAGPSVSHAHAPSTTRKSIHLQFDKSPQNTHIKVPTASLAKLEDTARNSMKPSLMDLLKKNELRALQPHQVHSSTDLIKKFPPASSSYLKFSATELGSLSSSSSSRPLADNSVNRKKVVIVRKPSKVLKPEDFLDNLKQNLSEDSFSKFKTCFAEYKKSDDFEAFFNEMRSVFNSPALHQLFLGILRFLKQKHIELFYKRYAEFTGRDIRSSQTSTGVPRKRSLEELSSNNVKDKRHKTPN